MNSRTNAWLGKSSSGYWFWRRWLAETRRPHLSLLLSWMVTACSLALLIEGVLLGWFLFALRPVGRGSAHQGAGDRGALSPRWVAALLVAGGLAGLLGGARLRKEGRLGAFLAGALALQMSLLGAALLYRGRKLDAPLVIGGGVLNLMAGLALADMLSLCWYTIDPLGLHWTGSDDMGTCDRGAVQWYPDTMKVMGEAG